MPEEQALTASEPCSVRDALLSSLKRDSPEMPDAPEEEPAAAPAPEKKRRRRRGIKDPSLRLNEDMMRLVIPCLFKTSVRHLFLMMMVSQDYRTMVTERRELWEALFKEWERKQCKTNPTSRSIGSDFAARCFQAMPKWMVKHDSQYPFHPRNAMHPSMPRAYVNPVIGNDWREAGVPTELRPGFDFYIRKVLCLWHIGCCGMCGTRQGKQRAIWSLNKRVCRGCWLANVVSHRSLLQVFLRARSGIVLVHFRSCGLRPRKEYPSQCELTCFCQIGLWDRFAQAAGYGRAAGRVRVL